MRTSLRNVQAYYDRDPDHEWTRFERQKLEMPITMHYIEHYLSPRSKILDIGGGGRYSIALAQRGHTVDLFDLSPELVALAKRKASEAGVSLNGFHVGTATDLQPFADSGYDAVLCMGPLYHLTDPADRTQAIRESLRVLKTGGLLVVSFISSYAHVFDLVSRDPSLILDWDTKLLATRCATATYEHGDRVFTSSFYIEPFEVSGLMAAFPLRQLAIVGAQGLVGQGQGILAKCSAQILKRWIELNTEVAETNGALASSTHIVYYGQKR